MDRLACVNLRADSSKIDQGADTVADLLRCFTPEVELAEDEPGTFWLNAAGLDRLHSSLKDWAEVICADLRKICFQSTMVVGFSRFGTYALARANNGVIVLDSPEQEAAATRKVPLSRLGLPLSALTGLSRLGKHNLGDLLDLPVSGLTERFGPEIHRLCSLAAGNLWDPLQPSSIEEPIYERIDLDEPEENALRLTFFAKQLLGPLLCTISERHHALADLIIALSLDRRGSRTEHIRPAAPTLDEAQLIDLIRLRLESITLPIGVVEISLEARTVPATTEQLHLFPDRPIRDLEAAERALARLRAEFGTGAVVRAKITEGHLPEARFAFEPVVASAPSLALPRDGGPRTLIRRVFVRPIPLQSRPVCGPRGCHLQGMDHEPFTRIIGPHIVSGGWWMREVHREYHFVESERGRILWVYFDKRRRLWFIHGEVT